MFRLKFPREVCNPKRKLVKTQEEFLDFINKNRNHYNLYTNVYSFTDFEEYKPIYDSAIIDRLFFDMDPKIVYTQDQIDYRPDNGYNDFITLVDWLLKRDIIFFPYLSGSGYHTYVSIKCSEPIKDKKSLIYNSQLGIIKKVNDELGNTFVVLKGNKIASKWHSEKEAMSIVENLGDGYTAKDGKVIADPRTIGKTDQIARIPFTYNFKSKRFCIPITENVLHLGDEEIKKKASDKSYVINLMKYPFTGYGRKVLDVSEYNYVSKLPNEDLTILHITPGTVINAKVPDFAPDCVKTLMSQKSLSWDLRRIEAIWLRDNSFTIEEAAEILKSHLTEKRKHGHRFETDYEHMIGKDDGFQLQNIYKKRDLIFPLHETMHRSGLCPFADKGLCKNIKYGCGNYGR